MMASIAAHLWQSTLVLLVAWLLTFFYRRNAADVRFLIWCGASLKFLVPLAALQWLGAGLGESLPKPLLDPLLLDTANALFTPALPASMALSEATRTWLAALAATLWASGALLLAWRWLREWCAVRSVLAGSHPLNLELPVAVCVTHSSAAALGVFGILRPVLIVPAAVLRVLSPQQLAAVLAHELCHVRRCDNLLAALHRCVEILFWFHPLVWWTGAQLLREREAACDEAVLEEGHERQVYAQSILEVCRSSVAARLQGLGASGGDLRQRISSIMSRAPAQPIDGVRFSLLLAAVTCLCFAPLLTGIAAGADRAAASAAAVKFDDVRLQLTTGWHRHAHFDAAAGQLRLQNVSLREVIRSAYPSALIGGDPYVIDQTRYDIGASWQPASAITERAAYRELLRQIVPRNVQLLVDGKCEVAC